MRIPESVRGHFHGALMAHTHMYFLITQEGFYQLDTTNNSFVKYDETIINDLNKRVDNYLLIIIVLGVETLILLMVLILNMIRKSRRKKKVKKIMLDKMNEKDKKVNNKEESEENIDKEEKK